MHKYSASTAKSLQACKEFKNYRHPYIPKVTLSSLLAPTFSNGSHPAEFVVGCFELSKSDSLILPGQTGANLLVDIPNTTMLALSWNVHEGWVTLP